MKDAIIATVFAKNVARFCSENLSREFTSFKEILFLKTRDVQRGATLMHHHHRYSLISQFLSSSSFDVQLLCCYKTLCRASGLLSRHRNKLNFPLLRLPRATRDAPRALRFQHLDGWYSIQ
jgi:hypothetical protein